VNAHVLLDVRHDVLTVPSPAVQRGPDGTFIWVVTANDTVQVRGIATGPATEAQTIITSGLSEGERVVVDGQYKLRPNLKVEVTAPALPQTPASTPAVAKHE
jgi:multidrug efflux system membrane fusion protein